MASAGKRGGVRPQALQQRPHRDAVLVGGRRRRVERGEREQVVDDALHARRLLLHHADVVAHALRIELELAHGLEEPHQHRERRAQLVRHVGDEVAPHDVDALGLGDVARQEHLLRLAERDELQCKREARIAGDANGLFAWLSQVFDELRVAHEVGDVLAEVGAALEPELRLGGAVVPLDAVRAVEDHHAVGQRLHRAAHARERVGEAFLALDRVALEPVQRGEHLVPDALALRHLAGQGMREPVLQAREVARMPEQEREQADGEDAPAPGGAEHEAGQRRRHGERQEREQRITVDQSVRKPYPEPRTVSIRRSWPVGSSALRRRRMCTSTVRSSMNTWSPQTWSSSCARV